MIEDSPPNVPANPVPEELTALSERKTLPPVEAVDSRMVALALSSMATTLERLEEKLAPVPGLVSAVTVLQNQHAVTLDKLDEAKGAANLAGSMAAQALHDCEEIKRSCDRIESAVGRLAQSMQGVDERTRSVYDSVFPDRGGDSPSTPPSIELADVLPMHRSKHVMTGE